MADKREQGTEKLVLYLPAETKAALRAAGTRSGLGERGMSEEVRRRLEASLEADKIAPEARQLAVLVQQVADTVTENFGAPQKDAFAFEVFRHAMETLLASFKPAGKPKPNFNPNSIADILLDAGHGRPEPIGRTLAAIAIEANRKSGGKP